jgi:ElaB/YqjD/DUF883 family membrane-anchored ribosome-binding protein
MNMVDNNMDTKTTGKKNQRQDQGFQADKSLQSDKSGFENKPFEQKLDSSASDISSSAQGMMSGAKQKVSDFAKGIQDRIPDNWNVDNVKQSVQPALTSTESMIRQYPWYSLLGAVAVGAILGAMLAPKGSKSVDLYPEQQY